MKYVPGVVGHQKTVELVLVGVVGGLHEPVRGLLAAVVVEAAAAGVLLAQVHKVLRQAQARQQQEEGKVCRKKKLEFVCQVCSKVSAVFCYILVYPTNNAALINSK